MPVIRDLIDAVNERRLAMLDQLADDDESDQDTADPSESD